MRKSYGLIEISGVVAALDALDIMCKAADVTLATWERKLGGRLVTIIVEGDVAAVTAAVEAGNAFLQSTYDVRDQAKAAELARAITDAISKLAYAPADFTAIDEALATVPKDLQNYTAETIKILEAAVEAATEAKATITRQDENWKAQVEAYAQAVLDAVSGLQKTGVIYADTSLLELALDMVDLYNPADYTNFSAVEMAVLSAESLLASNPTEAQQADVDAAAMEVLNAIGALEWA